MNQAQQIEYVACAFYLAEGDGEAWDQEPEILKSEFRKIAQDAIAIAAGVMGQEAAGYVDAA